MPRSGAQQPGPAEGVRAQPKDPESPAAHVHFRYRYRSYWLLITIISSTSTIIIIIIMTYYYYYRCLWTKHSLCGSPGHAIQRQKLLSSPWFGALAGLSWKTRPLELFMLSHTASMSKIRLRIPLLETGLADATQPVFVGKQLFL